MFRLIKAERGTEYVDVPNGENVLGRGPFLKVTDKRVSRNHALLICTGEKLELVPKHKNPCFYRKGGTGNFTVLAKDVTQVLEDGDEFSLLPKELVFKIEKIKSVSGSDEVVSHSKSDSPEKKEGVDEENEGLADKGRKELTAHEEEQLPLTTHEHAVEEDENDETDTKGTVISSKPRKLPSWLLTAAGGRTGGEGGVKETKNTTVKRAKSPEAMPDTKRTAVAKEDTIKPTATKKQEKTAKEPSRSKTFDDSNEVAESDRVDTISDSTSATATVDKKLPPCPYGKKCYRKNPVHFKEYSHDPDDDVTDDDVTDDGDKPACPYGTACYRQNPMHRKQYSHNAPPVADTGGSTSTGTSSRRPKRKAKVSALASDSDDDGQPNTYDYNDSFIDDADQSSEESTEYGGESEDSDWAPDVGEDVCELVGEVKDFMSNKKMHKPT